MLFTIISHYCCGCCVGLPLSSCCADGVLLGTAYGVRCTMYCILCTVHFTVYGVLHTVYAVLCSVYGVLHMVFVVLHCVCGTAYCVWYSAYCERCTANPCLRLCTVHCNISPLVMETLLGRPPSPSPSPSPHHHRHHHHHHHHHLRHYHHHHLTITITIATATVIPPPGSVECTAFLHLSHHKTAPAACPPVLPRSLQCRASSLAG